VFKHRNHISKFFNSDSRFGFPIVDFLWSNLIKIGLYVFLPWHKQTYFFSYDPPFSRGNKSVKIRQCLSSVLFRLFNKRMRKKQTNERIKRQHECQNGNLENHIGVSRKKSFR